MSARTGRVGRLTLVPILVLSAQVGVTAQHPTPAKPTPPAAQAKPAPAPATKAAPPPTTHGATPAPAAKPPVAKPPAAKPPVATTAPFSQLKVALDRIQQRVAATVSPAATPQIAPHLPGLAKGPTSPAAAAAKTPAPVMAAAPPPVAAPAPLAKTVVVSARPTVPATPRIQLSWRTTLAWPKMLTGEADAAPPAARRITLIWR